MNDCNLFCFLCTWEFVFVLFLALIWDGRDTGGVVGLNGLGGG